MAGVTRGGGGNSCASALGDKYKSVINDVFVIVPGACRNRSAEQLRGRISDPNQGLQYDKYLYEGDL